MKYISRTVWILSLISLFTDVASELLYPVMPIYLSSIQFSVALIGMLEGTAEAAAGLSKGYFGRWSDASGKRLPFVRWGYLLSALSKPMLAASAYPLWIFLSRTVDRLGKGVRTGARDAVLAENASPRTRGRIFGFHRSMDTLGAVLGPTLALLYLQYFPGEYLTIFLLAFFPGLLAVFLSLALRESPSRGLDKRPGTLSFLHYLRTAPAAYRKLLTGLILFALINSSDIFLLLKVKETTGSDAITIQSYIGYNLVYAITAYPLGILADRLGIRLVFLAGLLLFAAVYLIAAFGETALHFGLALILYGVYAAATEGVAKAWISALVEKRDTATAIGNYAGLQSVATLLASTLTGLVWWRFGAVPALLIPAFGAILTFIYLLCLVPAPGRSAFSSPGG